MASATRRLAAEGVVGLALALDYRDGGPRLVGGDEAVLAAADDLREEAIGLVGVPDVLTRDE